MIVQTCLVIVFCLSSLSLLTCFFFLILVSSIIFFLISSSYDTRLLILPFMSSPFSTLYSFSFISLFCSLFRFLSLPFQLFIPFPLSLFSAFLFSSPTFISLSSFSRCFFSSLSVLHVVLAASPPSPPTTTECNHDKFREESVRSLLIMRERQEDEGPTLTYVSGVMKRRDSIANTHQEHKNKYKKENAGSALTYVSGVMKRRDNIANTHQEQKSKYKKRTSRTDTEAHQD